MSKHHTQTTVMKHLYGNCEKIDENNKMKLLKYLKETNSQCYLQVDTLYFTPNDNLLNNKLFIKTRILSISYHIDDYTRTPSLTIAAIVKHFNNTNYIPIVVTLSLPAINIELFMNCAYCGFINKRKQKLYNNIIDGNYKFKKKKSSDKNMNKNKNIISSDFNFKPKENITCYSKILAKSKKKKESIVIKQKLNITNIKHNKNNKSKKLKKCKMCQLTYYCSKSCQKKHWKYNHRIECILLQNKLLSMYSKMIHLSRR